MLQVPFQDAVEGLAARLKPDFRDRFLLAASLFEAQLHSMLIAHFGLLFVLPFDLGTSRGQGSQCPRTRGTVWKR